MVLDRETLNKAALARDKGLCVICGAPATAVHHILDRALWEDGGNHIDNVASLCDEHHWDAERTLLTCEEIREKPGIINFVLPGHLYADERYDKWGNILLPMGQGRIKGELFFKESVQKILREAGVLP